MPELRDQLGAILPDRYAIERELGRGGMAIVYLARDLKHDRAVAIKVLRPELSSSIGVDRFLREITIAGKLTHPNILSLHDSGGVQGTLYYVMPYVEGESLRTRLARERQLPIGEALNIAGQVAAALDYAHAHGVVHRDIKPENILLMDHQVLVADFGLARAVGGDGSDRLTESGVAVGTPAYISPEQATAEKSLDGRTDIYSLGCVVFEMIAGIPPFHGATAQAVIAHHVTTPPPSLCVERATCPPLLDEAVRTALAKAPADRFRTAGEFARALEGARSSGPARLSSGTAGRPWAWRRRAVLGSALGAALVVSGGIALRLTRASSPSLDATRIVALTLAGSTPGSEQIARDATQRLRDALAQWSDVHLVDARTTHDALDDPNPLTLKTNDALAAARRLGAGRLLLGDVSSTRDSIVIRANLYDVARRTVARESRIAYAAGSAVGVQPFRVLANGLLRDRTELPWTSPEQTWTASLNAWSAYDAARRALESWDLRTAEQRLREALRIDPAFGQADLWLAQVLAWSTEDRSAEESLRATEEQRTLALRAINLGDRLSERDRAVAAGLKELAERNYPEACARFHAMLGAVPNDFAGWYGLGECLARDTTILIDSHSPSGYAFRSSWNAAAASYERALDNLPAEPPAFLYRQLGRVLSTNPTALRTGRLDRDKSSFLALPALLHDTLAYIPYPSRLSANVFRRQSEANVAVAANTARLARSLRAWVRLSPREPRAREMLGDILEKQGVIVANAGDSISALEQIRAARSLTKDSLRRVALSNTLVRLAIKADSFAMAATLADSLLRNAPRATAKEGESLVGLAALLGERHRTVVLLTPLMSLPAFGPTLPDGKPVAVPPSVLPVLADAQSRAIFGLCDDTLRNFSSRLDGMLASYVADSSERATARVAASWRVLSASVPCLGPSVVTGFETRDPLVAQQQGFARSASRGALARFDSVQSTRKGLRPGDVAIDYTYQEALLLLAAGDSATAAEHLDRTLDALPTLSVYVLSFPSQAAALVRAMALRADLGVKRGEREKAKRWAAAVAALWSHADPDLQPVVERMRRIASSV